MTEPTHDLPETSSDQRMHVLADDCWCEPEVIVVPSIVRHKAVTDD